MKQPPRRNMHGAAGDDPYGEGAVEEEEKDDDGLACLDSVGRRYALSGCAGLVSSRLCFQTASVFKRALFSKRLCFRTESASYPHASPVFQDVVFNCNVLGRCFPNGLTCFQVGRFRFIMFYILVLADLMKLDICGCKTDVMHGMYIA